MVRATAPRRRFNLNTRGRKRVRALATRVSLRRLALSLLKTILRSFAFSPPCPRHFSPTNHLSPRAKFETTTDDAALSPTIDGIQTDFKQDPLKNVMQYFQRAVFNVIFFSRSCHGREMESFYRWYLRRVCRAIDPPNRFRINGSDRRRMTDQIFLDCQSPLLISTSTQLEGKLKDSQASFRLESLINGADLNPALHETI